MDPCSAAAEAAGRSLVLSAKWWYELRKRLPMTAMPRAPPVWRVVSLIADPTPARAGGSDPMIDSVAGAEVSPRPMPNKRRTTQPPTNDDMIVFEAYSTIVAAIINDPITTTHLVPQRNTSFGALGDVAIMPTATGRASSPASNGE